jgi:hypothetical protein
LAAATGADSWPIVASLPFLLPLSSTVDCQKATALVDWIYWVSTSSQAFRLAARTDAVSSGQVPELQKRLLRSLSNVRCIPTPNAIFIHLCIYLVFFVIIWFMFR